jgi:3-isopropylmalate/(R)-2-methylmalate dehydratase small subunit
MGILRTSFLIDKQGRLAHVMDKVTTKTHHDDVLALQTAIEADPSVTLQLDVAGRQVQRAGQLWPLTLADGAHRMLVSGEWDGTSQLVAHDAELGATAARLPYLVGFKG